MSKKFNWAVVAALTCSMALTACAGSAPGESTADNAAVEKTEDSSAATEATEEAASIASTEAVAEASEGASEEEVVIKVNHEKHEKVDTEIFVEKIDDLPEDYICPLCKHDASYFVPADQYKGR